MKKLMIALLMFMGKVSYAAEQPNLMALESEKAVQVQSESLEQASSTAAAEISEDLSALTTKANKQLDEINFEKNYPMLAEGFYFLGKPDFQKHMEEKVKENQSKKTETKESEENLLSLVCSPVDSAVESMEDEIFKQVFPYYVKISDTAIDHGVDFESIKEPTFVYCSKHIQMFRNRVKYDEKFKQKFQKSFEKMFLKASKNLSSGREFDFSSYEIKNLEYLLVMGVDPNIYVEHEEKLTPAHMAVLFKTTSALQVLIDIKVNLRAWDRHGLTPLHFAASFDIENKNKADSIKAILKADPLLAYVLSKSKKTALECATLKEAEMAFLLIDTEEDQEKAEFSSDDEFK